MQAGLPPLGRFLILYGAMFAAFGVVAPFLPSLLVQDGLGAGEVGLVLGAGTGIRLLAGPVGGRLADRSGRAPLVLAGFAAASAVVALGYAPARGLPLLLLVSVAHAIVLAPLTPVADALALGSAAGPRRFPYGWVRGMGSAAFIVALLASGQLVERLGLDVVVWLNAALLAVAAGCALVVPNRVAGIDPGPRSRTDAGAARVLLAIPVYVRLMVVASLISGSHALHDGFAVIRWRAAGLDAVQCSGLWASSVAGEVVVFLLFGRRLLDQLGPGRAVALSAVAGIVRWGTAAQTAWFPAMLLVEPLHGLTFALLHLACMDVIARTVPTPYAARAQAFYATVAMGVASVAFTLASGPLYGSFGPQAFWVMAALCAAAVPAALRIRSPAAAPDLADVSPRPLTSS